MIKKKLHIPIGLRTLKTAAAVIIAMLIVDLYGATTSKLVFAMLGAMAAVQPTFRESLESCLTQIVGVLFGSVAGVALLAISLPHLVAAGIGIVLVITLYNLLHIRFSPSLPCFIVVLLCTTADIQPISYALGRIWDTAIGLSVGMVINTLVFPYDNSRQIRGTAEGLDKELILFLEDMFDGDEHLPGAEKMVSSIDSLDAQLKIFSNQKLFLHRRQQRQQLEKFRDCERMAKELVARMEVLCHVEKPGRLSPENRARLAECGADIRDVRLPQETEVLDVVTNYHVEQILTLREALLAALNR